MTFYLRSLGLVDPDIATDACVAIVRMCDAGEREQRAAATYSRWFITADARAHVVAALRQWTGKDQDAVCTSVSAIATFLGDADARAVVMITPQAGATVVSAFKQHADSQELDYYYETMSGYWLSGLRESNSSNLECVFFF